MIGIYQIHYDKISGQRLDPDFIPYFNNRKSQLFENAVILDIWKTGQYKQWDWIGVLSWRFGAKTGLSGQMVTDIINLQKDADVFDFSPHPYYNEQHPYNRKRFPPATELAAMIDQKNILPFKLWHYDTQRKPQNIWNNYWITKPEHFEKYCSEYLNPLVEYLQSPDGEIKKFCNIAHSHRDNGIYYTVIPFFLEGLFSVFCHREKLNIISI